MCYLVEEKSFKTCCETIFPYHQGLGARVTKGAYTKSKTLSHLIQDPLMLTFINSVAVGYDKLAKYLDSMSMKLHQNGEITITRDASNEEKRYVFWKQFNANACSW